MILLSLGLFPSKCGEHGPVQGGEIVFVKCLAKGLILRDLAVTMIVNDYRVLPWCWGLWGMEDVYS